MKFNLDDSRFLKFENVQLVDNSNQKVKTNGSLYLTNSHLVFKDLESKIENWIYFSLISNVEKLPLNTSGSPILIKCKHYQSCLFIISKERECQTLALTLVQYSRPAKLQDLLCFKPNEHLIFLKQLTLNENKKIFELESEYARLGVPNNYWSATDINANYEICDTYPHVLFVPTAAKDPALLTASANFRSRGRLPVLSYLHHNNASISRCAQPLSGLNARSFEDEQLLQHILFTNDKSKVLYVVDTRPKINAMANKAQGKGYENENNYVNTQFYFIGIENIHVMRSSLQKLIECSDVTNQSSAQFFSALEKTDWLKHVKAVIDTSIFIMDAVANQNVSVVVHCSDGWDRTAQTCALAGLLLDPYYRSIHGFQILIEKEWLMFGHKFTHRCGLIYENENITKEISPIFSQFLECVWQISQQFPCAFEFNERFLIKLHEHVYSSQFGTFIGNCQKERIELNLRESTYSYWDYVQYKINDFINPLYKPNSVYSRQVLKPDTRLQNLKYWRSMYNRFDASVNSDEKLTDRLLMFKNHTTALNDYAKLLEKRCAQLKTLIKSTENKETIESTEFNLVDTTSNGRKSLERESSLSLDQLVVEFNSLEMNWKSNLKNCSCSNIFDTMNYKLNCLKCGDICCEKCIEDGKYVSNHSASAKLIFICKKCLN